MTTVVEAGAILSCTAPEHAPESGVDPSARRGAQDVAAHVLGMVRDSLWAPDSMDAVLGFARARHSAADAGDLLVVMAALQRAANRMEAWQAALAAVVADSGIFVARTPEGTLDATAEAISLEADVSKRSAQRMVERGVFLQQRVSEFGAQYASGELSSSKMSAVVDVLKDTTGDVAVVIEEAVAHSHHQLSALGLKRELQRQLISLTPQEAAEVEQRAHAKRLVSRPRPDQLGMARMSMVLPAAAALRLHQSLDRVADRALAVGDGRTRAQLRADALSYWGAVAAAHPARLLAPAPLRPEDDAWYQSPLPAREDPERCGDVMRIVDPQGHPVDFPAWLGENWAERAAALLREPEDVPPCSHATDPWSAHEQGEFDPLEHYLLTIHPTAVDRAEVVQDILSTFDDFMLALAEPGLIPPDPAQEKMAAAVVVTVPADVLARAAGVPGIPMAPDAIADFVERAYGAPDSGDSLAPGRTSASAGDFTSAAAPVLTFDDAAGSRSRGSPPGTAWLQGFGPITPTTAALLAAGGTWRRLVTDPVTGRPLDLGRTKYQPPPYLQDMVRASQPVCSRPGCDRPASECEIDHAHEWHQGGTTRLDNLQPLCKRCHQLKTAGLLRTRANSDGTVRWYVTAARQVEPRLRQHG